jgi:hypothetical protein
MKNDAFNPLRNRRRMLLLAAVCLVALVRVTPAQDCTLDWFTIDSGGGQWSDGCFTIRGTIGQHDAAEWSDGSYALVGGFWGCSGTESLPSVPALRIYRTATNTVVLSWPGLDPDWVLQECSSLADGHWYTILPPLARAGGSAEALLPRFTVDKFYRLKQEAGAPVLSVEQTGTGTIVRWPAPAPGWVLERCVPSDGVWELAEEPCAQVGDEMQMILAEADGDFFRLTRAPTLSINLGPKGTVVVSWIASAMGWALLESPALGSGTWTTVAVAPVQAGPDLRQVALEAGSGTKFFRLAQISPAPSLGIALVEPDAVSISWPAPAVGWLLEESSSPTSGNWTMVSKSPVRVGDDFQVTISALAGNRFYRLKRVQD